MDAKRIEAFVTSLSEAEEALCFDLLIEKRSKRYEQQKK
jgi:hypothetical protein